MPDNPVDHPVIEPITMRWSPYRFEAREVEEAKLLSCFEAARWAASSFNDQPWYWLLSRRRDAAGFDKMLGCLLEANQGWASHADVLVVSVIRTRFAYNNKPNRVALHDLGQAACQLSLQAASLGLQVHQMAGVNLSRIRQEYGIPDDYEPQTALAIGYPDVSEPTTEDQKRLQKRQSGPRQRRPLAEQVFESQWGRACSLASGSTRG